MPASRLASHGASAAPTWARGRFTPRARRTARRPATSWSPRSSKAAWARRSRPTRRRSAATPASTPPFARHSAPSPTTKPVTPALAWRTVGWILTEHPALRDAAQDAFDAAMQSVLAREAVQGADLSAWGVLTGTARLAAANDALTKIVGPCRDALLG